MLQAPQSKARMSTSASSRGAGGASGMCKKKAPSNISYEKEKRAKTNVMPRGIE